MAQDIASKLELDDEGWPVLLAVQAPGQVAAQPTSSGASVQRGARVGNPWADPVNGQFSAAPTGNTVTAGQDLFEKLINSARWYIQQQIEENNGDAVAAYKSGDNEIQIVIFNDGERVASFVVPSEDSDEGAIAEFENGIDLPPIQPDPTEPGAPDMGPRSSVPAGVDPEAWERRLDAVRDAAREFDDMAEGDVQEFLKDRVQSMTDVNVPTFLKDVREQQIDDLVDVMEHKLRNTVDKMKRSARFVKVTAPAGWIKRVFARLTDDEVLKVATRLEGRGFDPEDLVKHVISKVTDKERRTKLEQQFGEKKKPTGKKKEDDNSGGK